MSIVNSLFPKTFQRFIFKGEITVFETDIKMATLSSLSEKQGQKNKEENNDDKM